MQAAQAVVRPLVVRADWWFTTPTIFIQPTPGLLMALQSGTPRLGYLAFVAMLIVFYLMVAKSSW